MIYYLDFVHFLNEPLRERPAKNVQSRDYYRPHFIPLSFKQSPLFGL